VVDYLVASLATTGIEYVFGVGGANIEDLYDAAYYCDGITAVLAKHEFSAATMADGYSRAGGQFGVVAATSGGASLNLLPALGESLTSRVPVLALVGQAPSTLDGRGSFQDTSGLNGSLDARAIFAEVSLYCRRLLRGADIADVLADAVAAARTGGPAVILLPKDVQQAMVEQAESIQALEPANGEAPSADYHSILSALRATTGPVTIIAGEQVARDDASTEFATLAAALGARVATVPDAKDLHGALGVTGVMGHPGVADAIVDSAVCVLVGTRLPMTASAGLEKALACTPTVSIGSAAPYVPCTQFHTTDLRVTLEALAADLAGDIDARVTKVAPENHRRIELLPPQFNGHGVRYRDAMAVLDGVLTDDVDIVVDAGNTGAAAIHHLPARRAGRFIVALGMGGMGYSFGAGLGVAFARPHNRTVVIAGDGAFFMHGMEIHTAVHYGLPVTFVLFNNNAHAMCVTREQIFYGDQYSYNRFAPSRLAAGLASMFPGLFALDVDQISDLESALLDALATEGPSVVCIECSADEIPPFAPFLDPGTRGVAATSPLSNEKDRSHVASRT
jgi:acetolactate synthase-1/2/3 large subunit